MISKHLTAIYCYCNSSAPFDDANELFDANEWVDGFLFNNVFICMFANDDDDDDDALKISCEFSPSSSSSSKIAVDAALFLIGEFVVVDKYSEVNTLYFRKSSSSGADSVLLW
ncbi:hypothetical protein WICMUC_005295 [Wickerhamomyces mucosus]|uniref:Uncharacterized protein n=1 Tax=Wickerhamomyces mucosus TaxID=1378264 RepID=A0A9P8P8L2_9ASCO|nr:hypothetical protein WICMUC_005295 [Wickerhamomyces mucosus]